MEPIHENKFSKLNYYDFFKNNWINDVRFKSSLLTDHFDAKENSGEAQINFSKYDLPFLAEENTKINADLGVKLSTQKSTFDLLNQNQSQYLVTSLKPKISLN